MVSFSEDSDNEKALAAKQGSGPSFVEGLHLFVLFSFAVSQPVFDILSQNPEFLVAHKTTLADLLAAIFTPLLLAPLAAVLLQKLLGIFNEELRRWTHLLMVFCLLVVIFNPPLKALPDSLNGLRVLSALLIAAAGTIAYFRWKSARSFLTFLSPSILIFPLIFISNGHIWEVVSQNPTPPDHRQLSAVSTQPKSNVPVVMLVFDELPLVSLLDADGNIDAARYPHFAALAAESSWYRNATTVSDSSTFAIPSLVTGNYPDPRKIPISRHYPDTFFSLFKSSHTVRAFESATLLCPPELRGGELSKEETLTNRLSLFFDTAIIFFRVVLPAKIGKHLPRVNLTWEGFGDPHEWLLKRWLGELDSDRLDDLNRFLKATEWDQQRSSFLFLHLLLPHRPFQFLPNGKRYEFSTKQYQNPHQIWASEEQVVLSYYRHLLQLGFVDLVLGEIVGHLKRAGLYDRSLLCVVADHGMSFKVGDFARRMSGTNAADILFVPLLIKAPGQREGRVDDQSIELVDVLPTIATILRIEPDWLADGRAASEGSPVENKEKRVLRSEDRKWIPVAPDPRARDLSLKRKIEWFGSGADENRLFYPKFRSSEIDQLITQIEKIYGIRQAYCRENLSSHGRLERTSLW